ncbi:glycosyltransferase [uncultured Aquimarina sp.]|uniref:glycosyltransferase family 2 protein n=1 Tax=uncultured Aquimarina sp. TaxID=575652 RepID=UPI002617B0EE|nr:glycosyltransferase [uncultured Aquimarina sp.]
MISTTIDTRDHIEFTFKEPIYTKDVNHRTKDFHLKITTTREVQKLEIRTFTKNPEHGFCLAGCYIQDIPDHNPDIHYVQTDEPLVSCIILLTFNDKFVYNFLIPSILVNTTIPYEIIIVYNGSNVNLELFKDFTIIQSETGCVSKAYNIGVAKAKGKYIALFHDDCLVTHYQWHDMMLGKLQKDTYAVSTEVVYNEMFDFDFLKGTPLVMTAEDYKTIGGHDEFYFAGIEDVDFSYQMIKKGWKIEKITMPYKHFNGMSTVILLNDQPELIKRLFGYCLIPENIIERWKTKVMSFSEIILLIQEVNGENLKYFNKKNRFVSDEEKKQYTASLTATDFPALFSIRTVYKEWLEKQFRSTQYKVSNQY